MTNTQRYCDNCSERIISSADKLTVSCSSIGTVSLDLCWKCAKSLHKLYQGIAEEVKNKRQEPIYLREAKTE